MSFGLISTLLKKYHALDAANEYFAECLRKDANLPFWLPENPEWKDKELVIQALTQLWKPESNEILPRAGIVCSSPSTMRAATTLNKRKSEFKTAVQAVRNKGQSEKTRIDVLIDRVLKQQDKSKRKRIEELTLALRRAQLNRLDLVRCYTQIRSLEKNLRSMSFTWAKSHSVIQQVPLEEAKERAEHLANEQTKKIALDLLNALKPGTVLAYKKSLPNQLRANLVYFDGDGVKRSAVTISGPVLSRDPKLPPKMIWRDNPQDQDVAARLTRTDSTVEIEPYVKALNLHLYNYDIR